MFQQREAKLFQNDINYSGTPVQIYMNTNLRLSMAWLTVGLLLFHVHVNLHVG